MWSAYKKLAMSITWQISPGSVIDIFVNWNWVNTLWQWNTRWQWNTQWQWNTRWQ